MSGTKRLLFLENENPVAVFAEALVTIRILDLCNLRLPDVAMRTAAPCASAAADSMGEICHGAHAALTMSMQAMERAILRGDDAHGLEIGSGHAKAIMKAYSMGCMPDKIGPAFLDLLHLAGGTQADVDAILSGSSHRDIASACS